MVVTIEIPDLSDEQVDMLRILERQGRLNVLLPADDDTRLLLRHGLAKRLSLSSRSVLAHPINANMGVGELVITHLGRAALATLGSPTDGAREEG